MSLSGYMAACWRELQKRVDRLHVITFRGTLGDNSATFGDSIRDGLSFEQVTPTQAADVSVVSQIVKRHSPDIVVFCGWGVRCFRQLVHQPEFSQVKFVMGMDNPWLGTLRQRFARLALQKYLKRMSLVVTSGERSWQYARRLGVSEIRLRRGMYGVDLNLLDQASAARKANCVGSTDWPKRFLSVGRLVDDKGIDTLIEAYSRYRREVDEPWPLDICGLGKYAERIRHSPGIHYHGFVVPKDMGMIWSGAGAFLLASRYDPWPLVLVEACGAGLPIVCSEACGSAVELVRQYYNGISVATSDAKSLATGMLWMHRHHSSLPLMGERSRSLALSYSAEAWAERWYEWLSGLNSGGSGEVAESR